MTSAPLFIRVDDSRSTVVCAKNVICEFKSTNLVHSRTISLAWT